MAKALVLKAITGSQIGNRHTFTARSSTIGSAANNDVVLHDRQITSRHAEIRQALDRWFVVPLTPDGSGISVNGREVRSQSRINAGDVVTLGTVTYAVSFEDVIEQEVGARPSTGTGSVPPLGDYFMRRRIMTADQVARTVQRQAELQRNGNRVPFGQVAYNMGFINRAQLEAALSEQRTDFNERFQD